MKPSWMLSSLSTCLTLILHKMLDKGISADGNPKANVAINHKARRREQRAEVIEGGIGSEHAHGGSVRVGRRDTLDEKLGLRPMAHANAVVAAVEREARPTHGITHTPDREPGRWSECLVYANYVSARDAQRARVGVEAWVRDKWPEQWGRPPAGAAQGGAAGSVLCPLCGRRPARHAATRTRSRVCTVWSAARDQDLRHQELG